MSAGRAIGWLLATKPNWIDLSNTGTHAFAFKAAPPRSGGIASRAYHLRVKEVRREIVVDEEPTKRLLPEFCPERHMNADGSFCLGFKAGGRIDAGEAAGEWWQKLEVFILCQETAASTGQWPVNAQISHGEAGEIQLRAEAAAFELNKKNDYIEALRNNSGPIAKSLWLAAKREDALINGRGECVCGRRRKMSRRGGAKLRRECRQDNDECLVLLEAKRRHAEEKFWERYVGKKSCCGSMLKCPLAL